MAVRIITVVGMICSFTAASVGKEQHYEQVRVLLMVRAARCTSCHTEAAGEALNRYGQAIAAQSKDEPMADRIAAVEADPPVDADASAKERARRNQDVDGDGAPNWVEVLAETSPGDGKDKPEAARVHRIETVVSCKMCHVDTNLPGEGLAANPHNGLGDLLAKTLVDRNGKPRPTEDSAVRAAAERTPILTRFAKVYRKKPKGSRASYWERMQMLLPPAGAKDEPTAPELRAFRKRLAEQRRKATRDPNRGLDAKAHREDGFLLDAKGIK